MLDEKILKTELARLLLADCGSRENQVTYREGQVSGIVFALIGKHAGYGCCERAGVRKICEWLGWGYKPAGSSGWDIDYDSDVDENVLREAGVTITPKER